MQIPISELSPSTLTRIIEEFILREGTNYGDVEYSLEQQVAQVRLQLDRGEAHLVYDDKTESIDIIVTKRSFRQS